MTDAAEVIRRCRLLADHSEEPGFTTRTFLSAPMQLVHRDVSRWMNEAGMDVRVDAVGNLRGVHEGRSADAPRLFIGSHLDTVPHAGAFDGVLGVVLAVALVERLNGERLPFAIEAVGFSDEEGVRFGIPFIGSRALAGLLDGPTLETRDAEGRSIADAIRAFGLDPGRIAVAAPNGPAVGYLEFHIEQGPVLDALQAPLGIVTAIVGQSRATVTFNGRSGHAGTTPMQGRRDALAGCAEWITAVEREALNTIGLVATVGRIDARPGAGNVIAGRCSATLDVRHADDRIRAEAVARLARHADGIATRRGLSVTWEPQLDQPAVSMDPRLTEILECAVDRSGLPVHRLPSGAGHDAMIVAARMPAAMLFLRSPGGISHHPDESVIEDDVALALEAGEHFLRQLAQDRT